MYVYGVYGVLKRLCDAESMGNSVYRVHSFYSVFSQLQPNCNRKRKGDSYLSSA